MRDRLASAGVWLLCWPEDHPVATLGILWGTALVGAFLLTGNRP